MGQVLIRAAALLRRPAVWVAGLLLGVGGSLLVAIPLFGLPGYELSAAVTLGAGLLGGVVGASAGFQERRLLRGVEVEVEPRPSGALRLEHPAAALLAAWAAAALCVLAAAALPFAVASLFAAVSTACDPFSNAGFYPVLVIPSAALSTLAGVLCALAARRPRGAFAFFALLIALSLAATFWPLLAGPQVFAYDHFLGYLPGPLYDEALTLPNALLWFRLQTWVLCGLTWMFGALLLDLRTGSLGVPQARPGVAAGVALFLALAAHGGLRAGERGHHTSRARLEEKLGGARESEHFQLYFPRARPRLEVDRLLRDLEFRHAQLLAFLGDAPKEKIRVYVYASAAQKRELVGASQTQFAKPWLRELHINDAPFPHPVLKHELTHIMASPFGAGPFDVTVRLGVWPLMGLIEGMAVAGDDPHDELTLHEWAAAMRKQKLAPDIRGLVRPEGFYASAPSRAYTLVGSFLRFLADTYGAPKLRALYAHGDFEGVYGRPLDALAQEWERYVDAVPLDEQAVNLAFERFRRPALFARACAREVATLSEKAAQALYSDPTEARELYARCAKLQPEEPAFALGEARALQRLEAWDEARARLDALLTRVKGTPALAADVLMAKADLARARGSDAEASAALQALLELRPGAATDRTARVKLAALGADPASRAIWSYLGDAPEGLKLVLLRDAVDPSTPQPILSYLLGRRLRQEGASRLAVEALTRALAGELPDSVRKEALRLLLEALFLSGDCQGVRDLAGRLPGFGAAFKANAEELVSRCAFEEKAFNGPLVPKESFR